MMSEESKKFFLVLLLLMVFSLGFAYYRFIYSLKYNVTVHIPCDPHTDTCFVSVCDPIEEECAGDPKEDTTYYAVLHKMAHSVPACDPNDEACQSLLTCQPGEEKYCHIEYCNEATVLDGERCSDETDATIEEDADTASEEMPTNDATGTEVDSSDESLSDDATAPDETDPSNQNPESISTPSMLLQAPEGVFLQ